MTEHMLALIVAWLDTPVGVTVVGAVLTFVAISIIKWTVISVLASFRAIPKKFERWLNRPQGML